MTGKWNQHIEQTKHKARIKATETLKIRSRIPDISTSILMKVYNAVVRSTLSYGAEIWGWDNTKDLNEIQTYFLKCLTGVGRSTANSGILKEFGTYRGSVDYNIKTLKYYLRILHGNQSVIKAACYREQRGLGAQNSWLGVLQKGLDEIGMGFILHEGEVVRKNVWRKVKKRLIDINRQEIEGDCREKITLELQTLTSINWGKKNIFRMGDLGCQTRIGLTEAWCMESEFFQGHRRTENMPTLWRGGFLASYTVLANCSASEDLRHRYLLIASMTQIEKSWHHVLTPEDYHNLYRNVGKVSDWQVQDFKSFSSKLPKLEGMSNMKRVRLMKKIKAGKSNINVTMEVSYRLDDPRHSRSLLKRGCRMDDITQPLDLPFCPSNVKPAKKVDVDRLLKQRFGEEWRNMPELKFYADIVDYQGNVT
ncbi:hypothetical protein C0J52_28258 [Blattella germanica]|nr:hypothetical protein C0J52_28258 [Blattella germanica]